MYILSRFIEVYVRVGYGSEDEDDEIMNYGVGFYGWSGIESLEKVANTWELNSGKYYGVW